MSGRRQRQVNPSPAVAAPKRSRLPLLLVALVLLAFGRLAVCQFVNLDDGVNLYQNPRLNPPSLLGISAFWREPWVGAAGLYIPVTYTVWGVLAWATWVQTPDEFNIHLDPHVFHGVNVLAHAIAAWLVYSLLNRLLRRPWAAFVGAAFFALHPLQVESVGWISGLKDVLCGLFCVAALNQYVASAQLDGEKGLSTSSTRRSIGWRYVAGLLAFVTAMLCKPTAMVTPALALVLDAWVLRRPARQAVRWVVPWFVIALPFAAIARVVQDAESIPNAAIWARPIVAGDALAFYLWKIVTTWPLMFDYTLSPDLVLRKFAGWVGWLLPLALAVLAWRRRKNQPVLGAALLLFIIPLLPNSGLATFQYLLYSVVADHYVYTAMLGPALLLAWVVDRFYRHRRLWIACGIGLAILAARTVFQAGVWRDNATLTQHSIDHNPYGFMAHNNRGTAFDQHGLLLVTEAKVAQAEARADRAREAAQEALEAMRRAREQYDISARLRPDNLVAWTNLISLDLRTADDAAAFREGRELVRQAIAYPTRITGAVISTLQDLSMQAYTNGRYEDSIFFLEQAVAMRPNNQALRLELSRVHAQIARMSTPPATTRAASGAMAP